MKMKSEIACTIFKTEQQRKQYRHGQLSKLIGYNELALLELERKSKEFIR